MDENKANSDISDFGTLLILGNGFDLDLGYPTSYKKFFENQNEVGRGGFPFVKGGHDYAALGRFILDAIIHGWYDLEDVLLRYSNRRVYHDVMNPEKDKNDYFNLVNSLALYLQSIDLSHPNKDSVAARVLYSLNDCFIPPSVYSFNYTDVKAIGDYLGVSIGPATHIHGSLRNNDIILGVGDYGNLTKHYDFMYKTANPRLRSTNLFQELDTCNNILIFGLSLSPVDYPYFEVFFKKVASGYYSSDRKKFIRIFTRDDSSRMDILRNLRVMNNGILALYNYADFDIIRTKDNIDEDKVATLLNTIDKEW